mmetsp:Transcript_25160/g.55810  ORF Transcript_25160/g.55810 Transcript_25160/m.55810 type:complete len:669 (+) Transcript_25160:599-2605(+)
MVIQQQQYSFVSTGLQKRPPKVNVDNLLIYDGHKENEKQQKAPKSKDRSSNRRGLYIIPKCEPTPEILQGREPEPSHRYRNSRSHRLRDREDPDQQREDLLARVNEHSIPPSSQTRTMRGQQQTVVSIQREYAISPSHKMKRAISLDTSTCRRLGSSTNAKLFVSLTKSTHSPKSPRSYKASRLPRSPRKPSAREIESAKGAQGSSHMRQQQKQRPVGPRSRPRQRSVRTYRPDDTPKALDDRFISYLGSCMGAFDLYDFLESSQRYLQQDDENIILSDAAIANANEQGLKQETNGSSLTQFKEELGQAQKELSLRLWNFFADVGSRVKENVYDDFSVSGGARNVGTNEEEAVDTKKVSTSMDEDEVKVMANSTLEKRDIHKVPETNQAAEDVIQVVDSALGAKDKEHLAKVADSESLKPFNEEVEGGEDVNQVVDSALDEEHLAKVAESESLIPLDEEVEGGEDVNQVVGSALGAEDEEHLYEVADYESLKPLDEEVEARTAFEAASQSRNHAANEASRANEEGEDVIQAVDLVLDTINEEPLDAVAALESPTASMRLQSICSRRLQNLLENGDFAAAKIYIEACEKRESLTTSPVSNKKDTSTSTSTRTESSCVDDDEMSAIKVDNSNADLMSNPLSFSDLITPLVDKGDVAGESTKTAAEQIQDN